eukprot:CAMPEP_0178413822 /NCGR_PEP_ID=MMETSP0689_2-20121128/22723_1 /TAXON_ID=160604 /ORGANISM="Amphidinium massartii, Strain CS-259" /LENGTH=507 /DNA_ID=CAMNT_0020035101 /DNA_START=13 /DNA_END=1532 /DNA_ORIENTATION=+
MCANPDCFRRLCQDFTRTTHFCCRVCEKRYYGTPMESAHGQACSKKHKVPENAVRAALPTEDRDRLRERAERLGKKQGGSSSTSSWHRPDHPRATLAARDTGAGGQTAPGTASGQAARAAAAAPPPETRAARGRDSSPPRFKPSPYKPSPSTKSETDRPPPARRRQSKPAPAPAVKQCKAEESKGPRNSLDFDSTGPPMVKEEHMPPAEQLLKKLEDPPSMPARQTQGAHAAAGESTKRSRTPPRARRTQSKYVFDPSSEFKVPMERMAGLGVTPRELLVWMLRDLGCDMEELDELVNKPWSELTTVYQLVEVIESIKKKLSSIETRTTDSRELYLIDRVRKLCQALILEGDRLMGEQQGEVEEDKDDAMCSEGSESEESADKADEEDVVAEAVLGSQEANTSQELSRQLNDLMAKGTPALKDAPEDDNGSVESEQEPPPSQEVEEEEEEELAKVVPSSALGNRGSGVVGCFMGPHCAGTPGMALKSHAKHKGRWCTKCYQALERFP